MQARHAWTLQTKQNVIYMGMGMPVPCGFVEPVPDFFAKMGTLAEKTIEVFQYSGAYDEGRYEEIAEQIRASASVLKRLLPQIEAGKRKRASDDDMAMVGMVSAFCTAAGIENTPKKFGTPEGLRQAIAKLEAFATQLETNGPGTDAKVQMALSLTSPPPATYWYRFGALCSKLEALSQKQLRGAPFSTEDNDFLKSYGERLAGIMFYGGNSYENPRDDAPRVCDIYTNPQNGEILHIGIGKPVQIFLLYPWNGKPILTHGAVFPYYEFGGAHRLTDTEWQKLQSSPLAPAQPDWLGAVRYHR
jgi:hypothetical protein